MEEFKEKNVDGYYVRPMMQRVRAVQMDVLHEIDVICKKHSLNWFADWGTLLGAVRHNGYIPWDDDLDIGMFRLDFEKFKRYAREELPKQYSYNLDRDDNINKLTFCIYNGSGINTDPAWLERNHGCPYPAGVDIFVYDNIPDDKAEREDYLAVYSYTSVPAQELKEGMTYEDCNDELKQLIDMSEKLTGMTYTKDLPMKVPMLILADQIAAMYYDASTEHVAIAGCLTWGERYLFKRKWMDEIITLPFEEIRINCPAGYDEILRIWYGDNYMIPQKYEEHEDYYGEQEKILFSWYRSNGMEIPALFLE